MSRHNHNPSDVERENPPPGGLARATPIKPQLAIPAMTREAKESREQTQLWDVSLNKVFQNMHGDDTARFLSYFKARLEIEETYSRSLEKLSASAKGGHKHSIEPEEIPTTVKMAFDALVDTTLQLHLRRKSFLKLLKTLTGALSSMKDNHEKQRKSQKETIRPVFQLYAETRLSTVPKFKRAYEQRCRDVEQALSNEDNEHLPVIEKLKNLTSSTGAAGRLVKNKREMEEADNEYKTAVKSLEVYRQKREQLFDSSYQTMQTMINERGSLSRYCLEAYVVAEREMMSEMGKDMDRLSTVVSCIKPAGDVEQICMTFVKDINSHPKPVLYENYYQKNVPESIFGLSLLDYVRRYHRIPVVIIKCSEAIDRSGLRREGIYRVSGRHALIMKLKKQFEQNEDTVDLNDPSYCDDTASIAAVLKIYLRELPEPLFPFSLNERIAYSAIPDKNVRLGELRARLKRLPDCNIDTLQYLIQHLSRVFAHVEENKMTLDNLSMIFTPAIFHDFNSAMVTGPQGAVPAGSGGLVGVNQQTNDSLLSFNSTAATSSSPNSPGPHAAPWSANSSEQQHISLPALQPTAPLQFFPQNPTLGFSYNSDPSSPAATTDPSVNPPSYSQAPAAPQIDQTGGTSVTGINQKTNPAYSISSPTSTTTGSFIPPNNTVSAAASWSNDLVLADLILNCETIFNVLPKLPNRSNTAASPDDRMAAAAASGIANISLRSDPHNSPLGRSYSTSRKSSSSSLGGSGTPTSPTDGSGQLRPRMDSLGPNSGARTAPPIVSPTSSVDQYQYHLPPIQQQQFSFE
ncbi:hypothetical protein BGZ49_001540, partial [Haplosporangium sp. Z 27]